MAKTYQYCEGKDAAENFEEGMKSLMDSDARKRTCTCPKTLWTGDEMSESTCILSEEEHQLWWRAYEAGRKGGNKVSSPANEIDELANYISAAASVDQERVSDLLWAIYHKASDDAVERLACAAKRED